MVQLPYRIGGFADPVPGNAGAVCSATLRRPGQRSSPAAAGRLHTGGGLPPAVQERDNNHAVQCSPCSLGSRCSPCSPFSHCSPCLNNPPMADLPSERRDLPPCPPRSYAPPAWPRRHRRRQRSAACSQPDGIRFIVLCLRTLPPWSAASFVFAFQCFPFARSSLLAALRALLRGAFWFKTFWFKTAFASEAKQGMPRHPPRNCQQPQGSAQALVKQANLRG